MTTPEEAFERTIWWVLREIGAQFSAALNDEPIYFGYNSFPYSPQTLQLAIEEIRKAYAIQIIDAKYPLTASTPWARSMEKILNGNEPLPVGVFLKRDKKEFNKIYGKYEKRDGPGEVSAIR